MLSGKKIKAERDRRKRPVHYIKPDTNVYLQHCQLSLSTANTVWCILPHKVIEDPCLYILFKHFHSSGLWRQPYTCNLCVKSKQSN